MLRVTFVILSLISFNIFPCSAYWTDSSNNEWEALEGVRTHARAEKECAAIGFHLPDLEVFLDAVEDGLFDPDKNTCSGKDIVGYGWTWMGSGANSGTHWVANQWGSYMREYDFERHHFLCVRSTQP